MATTFVEVDVRPIQRTGGEPFEKIMETVSALEPGQGLKLFATFKPTPLLHVPFNLIEDGEGVTADIECHWQRKAGRQEFCRRCEERNAEEKSEPKDCHHESAYRPSLIFRPHRYCISSSKIIRYIAHISFNTTTRRPIMAKQLKPRSCGPSDLAVTPTNTQTIAEAQSEWDVVMEASWESFPASDAPAWIGRRSAGSLLRQARS